RRLVLRSVRDALGSPVTEPGAGRTRQPDRSAAGGGFRGRVVRRVSPAAARRPASTSGSRAREAPLGDPAQATPAARHPPVGARLARYVHTLVGKTRPGRSSSWRAAPPTEARARGGP